MPWSAYVCFQPSIDSGTCARTERRLQHETFIAGNNEICTPKVSKNFAELIIS